ncbi:hypothetical protein FisN_5Lh168 [Fistulifera solaris]|uniref:YDG domain-containing protein n=1 Tax=Fistulifera solaris TaxID=1519565 RepID=A0A1Z5JIT7_FISSO|nr:hypothetical protein FisN_5Lh168 [Fistulifera solaris]|eukprot:GAX13927.1 hypothetical protein FisN_5Lh168 [Fistulifera solaris]
MKAPTTSSKKKLTKSAVLSCTKPAKKIRPTSSAPACQKPSLKKKKKRIVAKKAPSVKVSQPPLIQRRHFDGKKGEWSPFRSFEPETWQNDTITIPLQRGGTLTLYPGWLNDERERRGIVRELNKCDLFRVYQTQSTNQPRAQFLLHKQAKDDFKAPNPGYDYRVAKMKAFPLKRVKGIEQMWDRALEICQVGDFRIGANVIYYRGSNDRIHYHADDNQGESVIFAVVVNASRSGRCVSIKVKEKGPEDGDSEYKIFPGSGDAYLMDGLMQQNYIHAVLPKKNLEDGCSDPREARVVVIFRDGLQKTLKEDTGTPIYDLRPPPPLKAKPFGNCVEGLVEGKLYTRAEMIQHGYHLTQQGVSGSRKRGCEAISLSGEYKGDDDTFDALVYTANLKSGARAMLVNFPQKIPIRVFRKQKGGAKVLHRYDGVYRIIRFFGEKSVSFFLKRNPVGTRFDENRVEAHNLRKLPLYGLDTKEHKQKRIVK